MSEPIRPAFEFTFNRTLAIDEVADTLRLARLATEALHGESMMALEARSSLDRRRRGCVVDAGSDVGRDLAKLFITFLLREFGEGSFRVERRGGALQEASA